jgi:hypothetical protein
MTTNVQGLFLGLAPFWLSARTDITAMVARKALGITVPLIMQMTADDVIE